MHYSKIVKFVIKSIFVCILIFSKESFPLLLCPLLRNCFMQSDFHPNLAIKQTENTNNCYWFDWTRQCTWLLKWGGKFITNYRVDLFIMAWTDNILILFPHFLYLIQCLQCDRLGWVLSMASVFLLWCLWWADWAFWTV